MSVMTARTGVFSYAKYGWESSFKAGSTSRNKAFGRGVRVSSVSRNENLERVYELGERSLKTVAFKAFEGSVSVDFFLSNPWFLRAVLGSVATSGSGPYTHTYSVTKLPQTTMEIEVGFQGSGADVVRLLRGCVVSGFSMRAAVNELIGCRLDILYADEVSGSLGSGIVDTFEPFVFQHATLEIPAGNVVAEVQSLDLTISNNALMVWGLGDVKASSSVWQNLDVTGRVSVTMKNRAFLDKLRTTDATGAIKIYSAADNSITFNFNRVSYGEHSVGYEPNALVVEEVPVVIHEISNVVAVNNVGTHP